MQQKLEQLREALRLIIRRSPVVAALGAVCVVAAIVLLGLIVGKLGPWHKSELQVATDKATERMESGDYAGSLQTLKESESKAETKEEKLNLYADLAGAAGSTGDMEQALRYLTLRHELEPSTAYADAYLMGGYYERVGNITEALRQYQMALEYQKSLDDADTSGEVANLQSRIDELKGQQ